MTVRRITGTGATNGATVTANGTPGGNALTVLSVGGTATLVWSTTGVPSGLPAGSKAIRMQCPATTDTVAAGLGAQTAAPLAGSIYLYAAAWNNAVVNLAQYRTSGQNGGISLDATHHLRITNAGGTVLKVFTNALSLNTQYRIDAFEDPATTTTGTVQFGYYLEHDTTPVETLYSVTNVNVGTSDNTEFRIAKSDTTGTCDFYIWGLADDNAAAGLIGPASVERTAAVALSGSSTLAVTPLVTEIPAVALAGSSALAVSPLVTELPAVALAGSGTLTVTPLVTQSDTVALAGTSALSVTAEATRAATVALAGDSSLAVTAGQSVEATVALVGSNTVTVSPLVTHTDTVAIVGSSTVDVTPLVTHLATVLLAGTSDLQILVQGEQSATVALVGSSSVDVTPAVTALVSVPLTGAGSLTVAGAQSIGADVVFVGAGTLDVAALVATGDAVPLAGTSALTVIGEATVFVAVTLVGASDLILTGEADIATVVNFDGTTTLTITAAVITVVGLRDITITVELGDPTWSGVIVAPNWTASLSRPVWRGHIDPVEDPVYATDRAIYTPPIVITGDHDLTSTVFKVKVNDGDYVDPDVVEVTGTTARLKLLLGTATGAYPVTAGYANVFVQIDDSPEDFDLFAGRFTVKA